MSADAAILSDLQQLLGALTSTDNAARSRAEDVLATDWVGQRPEMLMYGLASTIRTNNNPNDTVFAEMLLLVLVGLYTKEQRFMLVPADLPTLTDQVALVCSDATRSPSY
ncbi:hypothetical protein ABW20_dc0103039 [Dactylellina cionopaga]|nr:hypothetical protein ABW20_dc0103039 [Dactylellina cionopaga]